MLTVSSKLSFDSSGAVAGFSIDGVKFFRQPLLAGENSAGIVWNKQKTHWFMES